MVYSDIYEIIGTTSTIVEVSCLDSVLSRKVGWAVIVFAIVFPLLCCVGGIAGIGIYCFCKKNKSTKVTLYNKQSNSATMNPSNTSNLNTDRPIA